MGRIVEMLVGISALAGIATFLGVRSAVRHTLRTLGRKPEATKKEPPATVSFPEELPDHYIRRTE